MRGWLRETHGTLFELLRHFLRRFFDSELITAPGHASAAMIALVSMCLPWFQVLMRPLKQKYEYLSGLPIPEPYRQAVRADELWLLTLMMSLIGLLTAVRWQALFPDLRDYRSLGTLPLRARQIFLAKLLALLIVAAAALLVLNLVPSTTFPALSASRWAFHGPRVGAYALASVAGCAFGFFGLVGSQGVLLNVVPPRAFDRVAGYVQGLLVAFMIGVAVLSFSIQPQFTSAILQGGWAKWLPPVWFLGLCESRSGDPDPMMHALAHRALVALMAAAGLTLFTYLLSCHRHRTLLMEGASGGARERRVISLLEWVLPDARQQAVIAFMLQTLARSSHHRMVAMGYGGLALAVLLSGWLGMANLVAPERAIAGGFVYFHVIIQLFLLIGARHLFSLPTELKANWLFQITEADGRLAWLRAVDRFLFFWFAVMMIVPLPFELHSLGWRAIAEVSLLCAAGQSTYNWLFSNWNKLPFTCSHLPGKTPGWIMALRFFGVVTLVPILNAVLLATLYNLLAYVFVLAALTVVWIRARAARHEGRGDLRLQYEELPDPAVYGLNLNK